MVALPAFTTEAKRNPGDIVVEARLDARDWIELTLQLDGDKIVSASLRGRGCTDLLNLLALTRSTLTGSLKEVPLPKGDGHAAILMREVLLKARGEWKFPYEEEELCHCRAVPTSKVDQAIVGGCHSVFAVARQTSAGTSCGTCRPNTERIIAYRLGRS